MEQPDGESPESLESNTGSNQEQSHTVENSAAGNAAETTSNKAEQPTKESEKKNEPDRVDDGIKALEERLGISATADNSETPSDKSKEKKEEVKDDADEDGKSEEGAEENADPNDDYPEEIELEDGKKLVAVKVDGITVHTTPDKATEVKNGLLRQSDYTKKTQALNTEKQQIAKEKAVLINQIKEYQKFQEESDLAGGFDDPEPLESEYIDAFLEDDEKAAKIQEFRKDKTEWLKRREEYMGKKAEYTTQKKQAEAMNVQNSDAFIKEYGSEALEDIYPELMEIRQALKTTGTKPFPKDMLRNYYRGKNFDKLVKAEVEKERKKILNQVDNNVKRTSTATAKGSPTGGRAGDEFDKAFERIKSRGASW